MKRILLTFIGFLSLIGLFHLSVENTCGPNAEDVAVMKPQAELIDKYILQNGIPESLSSIEGLSYGLENCVRKKIFSKYVEQEYKVDTNPQGADGEIIEETCVFRSSDKTYNVKMRFDAGYKHDIDFTKTEKRIENVNAVRSGKGSLVLFAGHSETGVDYYYEFDKKLKKWAYYNNPFMDDEEESKTNNPQIYSTKNDGICNPMRM